MSAELTLDTFGEEQGWNDESKLAIALKYIDNQQHNDAFEEFVQQEADLENGV